MELYGLVLQQFSILVLITLISLICWYYWTHRKILSAARKLPPVIPTIPLLGHAYLIAHGIVGMTNIAAKRIKEVVAGTTSSGVFWAGPYPMFLIAGSEDLQILLNSTKSFEGAIEHPFMSFALGNGLITAPGYIWKVTRRHINPLFHPRNLEQLLPALNRCGHDLVFKLLQNVSSGHVDVEPLVYPVALKSTCLLIFGAETEIDMESLEFCSLMAAITRISQLVAERLMKVWLWPQPVFNFLYRKEIDLILTSSQAFITQTMELTKKQKEFNEKMSECLDKKPESEDEEYCMEEDSIRGSSNPVTLEDTYKVLQQNYPSFSEKDLHNEVRTLLLGGSESTRITLSSCMLALAAHPDIQEKLYSEVVSVVGCEDIDVTSDDLKAMPYLDQVLRETLRKFLVIPMITRKVQEDLKLSNFTLPAGAMVGALLFGVHFNPKDYPDPEKFDPDRFTPENVARRHKYAFVPFSGGPRNCIGKNYSMIVLKTLLIHILRRFRLSTTVDIEKLNYLGGVITGYVEGYKLELHLRQKPVVQTYTTEHSGSFVATRHCYRADRFID